MIRFLWLRLAQGGALLCLLTLAGVIPASGQSCKFLVLGDSRGPDAQHQINTNILTELVSATLREQPAFVVVPGDLINSGSLAGFQEWTNLMGPVYRAGIGVYPVIGNHDAADVASFIKVFGPSIPDNGPAGEVDRTYAVAYSNVLVLMLDNYVANNSLRVNQPWVDSVLATNTRPHVFAMGHVPAFKVLHADCLDDYPANRNAFWASLRSAGCRVYFCGHDHFYDHMRLAEGDRTPNNDLHQMIVGTGGAPIAAGGAYDGVNALWTPSSVLHQGQYGYVSVEIVNDNVRITWHRRTGANTYAAGETFAYTVNLSTPPPPPPVIRTITSMAGN